MEKVAIYCRLSDEDRNKKHKTDESESIQNQKSMLVSYAVNNNYDIYNIYADDDYSGTDKNRPQFNKMLEDCKNGEIDIVLCKTQSRFSRDMEIIEKYIHGLFLEWNVRFISIVDSADSSIESNKKSRQINGLINEWYLEDLSKNIRKTLDHKKRNGEFVGSFAPYGYITDPNDRHRLIVDENVRHIVKLIFDMYDKGYGYVAIVKHLNKEKIPPPSLYKKEQGSNLKVPNVSNTTAWNTKTLQIILQNEVYIGNMVQGKRKNISYKNKKKIDISKDEWIKVENTHEAIIDKELFERIQKRFSKRLKPNKTGEIQIFSKKVYCSECGKIFTKNVGRSCGRKYYYLHCKGKKDGFTLCDNKYALRLDMLEELVTDEINKIIKMYKNNTIVDEKLLELKSKEKTIDIEKRIEINYKEIEKNNKRKNKNLEIIKELYADKVMKHITLDEFLHLKEEYAKEIEKLDNLEIELNIKIEELKKSKEETNNKIDLLKKYDSIKNLNRTIIEEFIDIIHIGKLDTETKSREINISWNV